MKNPIFLLITFTLIVSSIFAEGSWELEKNSNGIKVYTRVTSTSPIKEFKAITTINSDKLRISNIVMKVSNYVN